MKNEFKNILKDKVVNADEIVSTIKAQVKDCGEDVKVFAGKVEDFIYSHAKATNGTKVTTIDPPERERIYHYADCDITLRNVCELAVGASGTHRLKTTDGKYHIIKAGWRHIELDIDKWSL